MKEARIWSDGFETTSTKLAQDDIVRQKENNTALSTAQ